MQQPNTTPQWIVELRERLDKEKEAKRAEVQAARYIQRRQAATIPKPAKHRPKQGLLFYETFPEPTIEAWFDGAVEAVNPGGHATWGIAVNVLGKPVCRRSGYVGFGPEMSSNVAEFAAFRAALEEVLRYEGPILIRGDSQIVVNAMNGPLKNRQGTAKSGKRLLYVPYYHVARDLLVKHLARVRVEWIPREENAVADALSKNELRYRHVLLRIQPENRAMVTNET